MCFFRALPSPTPPHLRIDLFHNCRDVIYALDVPGGRIAAHVPTVDGRVGEKVGGSKRQLCRAGGAGAGEGRVRVPARNDLHVTWQDGRIRSMCALPAR